MARRVVNLDAMILREDIAMPDDPGLGGVVAASNITGFHISELESGKNTFHTLRKPDFQRETRSWTPEIIAELVRTFVDNELIPAIIIWRAKNGTLFVVDGAHRLSALIAWVNNDYGDHSITQRLYKNKDDIPPEQMDAAQRTRKLIDKIVGPYAHVSRALTTPQADPKQLLRARNIAANAIPVQVIPGEDSNRAEAAFHRINQQGTPIDATDTAIIMSRHRASAIATRAIMRAGAGHKYWHKFEDGIRTEIEVLAKEIHGILFRPPLEQPIKSLDLPIAGSDYLGEGLRLVFEFINSANDQPLKLPKKREDWPPEDKDGSMTVQCLKNARRLAWRLSGTHASSLGLHPAVYTYTITGNHSPAAFLAAVMFVRELEKTDDFFRFADNRDQFEEFLVSHRQYVNQIVGDFGARERSVRPLFDMYILVYHGVIRGNSHEQILQQLRDNPRFNKSIREISAADRAAGKNFSREAKSAVFLRETISTAPRCRYCRARIHSESHHIDHVLDRKLGGLGHSDNGALAHPYCNSTYKSQRLTAVKE